MSPSCQFAAHHSSHPKEGWQNREGSLQPAHEYALLTGKSQSNVIRSHSDFLQQKLTRKAKSRSLPSLIWPAPKLPAFVMFQRAFHHTHLLEKRVLQKANNCTVCSLIGWFQLRTQNSFCVRHSHVEKKNTEKCFRKCTRYWIWIGY